MALPGKKQTRSRTHKRRSAWLGGLKAPILAKCPKCNTPKKPHSVCPVCGTYKGAQIIKVKHKVTRAERRAAARAQAAREKKERETGLAPKK